ncbi:monovalent cation/H(+) antiporter subunit G [Imhoffiella purpurea]|uniref:Monovalent cation/proton antiporter, MnhG/PhaG subunit n=1 Tax=Imhoffiella purpurea TaxID=1249627 RepID=W9V6S5_9GAMM|nr:monovalent cation/H(+) antiporter subunit G [Imhoffiella purpurea]EXJ15263.1 monovalent cation/proton antiporter, MnhG/PhaG subunit [Imhoffiella purpurea]
MELLGYGLMLGGAFFFWVSGLGLIRMPDVFTRMHAGAKSTTMGSLLMLFGAACVTPEWAPRLLLLALFILLTNPISSSVLARAAHRSGTVGARLVQDDYATRQTAGSASRPDDGDEAIQEVRS